MNEKNILKTQTLLNLMFGYHQGSLRMLHHLKEDVIDGEADLETWWSNATRAYMNIQPSAELVSDLMSLTSRFSSQDIQDRHPDLMIEIERIAQRQIDRSL